MDLFSIQPKKKVKSSSHHHDPCSLFPWPSYGLEKTGSSMCVDLAVRQLIGMLYLRVLRKTSIKFVSKNIHKIKTQCFKFVLC